MGKGSGQSFGCEVGGLGWRATAKFGGYRIFALFFLEERFGRATATVHTTSLRHFLLSSVLR
jgi:hypothetical protein